MRALARVDEVVALQLAALRGAVPTSRDLAGVGALTRVNTPVGRGGTLGGGSMGTPGIVAGIGTLFGVHPHVVCEVTLGQGLVATLCAHMLPRRQGWLGHKIIHFSVVGEETVRVVGARVKDLPVVCCFAV